jgi:transcriptional regulator with XRE-family HTH domain
MTEVFSERLRTLREGMKLSQAKIAALVGTTQTSINRYEKQVGLPPHQTLLWYADYFDVSMDYLYGRTDKPHGKQYKYRPKVIEDSAEMRQFIEMCFDPKSPMSGRLKDMLFQMMKGGEENE